jgi:hypothetical protein
MVIGEAKPDLRGKELVRKVEYEKTPDGKETFKVTLSASGHGRQGSSTPADQRPLSRLWPDRSDQCAPRPSKDDQTKPSGDW